MLQSIIPKAKNIAATSEDTQQKSAAYDVLNALWLSESQSFERAKFDTDQEAMKSAICDLQREVAKSQDMLITHPFI